MHKIVRKSQFLAQQPDLVLKQVIQRLQNGLKLLDDFPGQQPVVVALDDIRVSGAGFDDVGINGALGKEVLLGDAEFQCLVQEHIAKLGADDLPLALGILYALQLVQKTLLGIHTDKMNIPFFEGVFHLVALIFAHTAVIHKDRRQPVANRFR